MEVISLAREQADLSGMALLRTSQLCMYATCTFVVRVYKQDQNLALLTSSLPIVLHYQISPSRRRTALLWQHSAKPLLECQPVQACSTARLTNTLAIHQAVGREFKMWLEYV